MDSPVYLYVLKARAAAATGDRRAVQVLIRKILEYDLYHAEAWRILLDCSAAERSPEAFQDEYLAHYFPHRRQEFISNRQAYLAGLETTRPIAVSRQPITETTHPFIPAGPPPEVKQPEPRPLTGAKDAALNSSAAVQPAPQEPDRASGAFANDSAQPLSLGAQAPQMPGEAGLPLPEPSKVELPTAAGISAGSISLEKPPAESIFKKFLAPPSYLNIPAGLKDGPSEAALLPAAEPEESTAEPRQDTPLKSTAAPAEMELEHEPDLYPEPSLSEMLASVAVVSVTAAAVPAAAYPAAKAVVPLFDADDSQAEPEYSRWDEPIKEPPRYKRRADFEEIKACILYLGSTGSLVVPIIVVGELILQFLADFASTWGGNFLISMGLGALAVLAICFLLPFVGVLVTLVLRVMMVIGAILGRVFGYALGAVCAVFYYLTLWAPPFVSSVVCLIAGAASGWCVAKLFSYVGNTELLGNPGPWFYLHYLSLMTAGGVGGWYFVRIVQKAERGELIENPSQAGSGLFKSARKLYGVTNTTENLSNEGKRILHN